MKLWFLLALLVLVTIVVVQNAEVVTVRFLIWEASLSRVVLLLLSFVAGALTGFVAGKLPRAPTHRGGTE